MTGKGPNHRLKNLLAELNWTPYQLAHKINRIQGTHYVHRTTPLGWCKNSSVPYHPLPGLIAAILSEACGRIITVEELWPELTPERPHYVLATDGMDAPLTQEGTLSLIRELRRPSVERRQFFAASGLALTAPVIAWQAVPGHPVVPAAQGERVTPAMIDYLEADTLRLHHLDDGPGGAPLSTAISTSMACVVDLLDNASYDARTGDRLNAVLTELASLAGWNAFDTGKKALSQRYRLMALRTAHTADNRPLSTYLMASLAFQQGEIGKHGDASDLLATASSRARNGATPRTLAWLSLCEAWHHARIGDGAACASAISRADSFLAGGPHENDPMALYWLNESVLLDEEGWCRLKLGDYHSAASLLHRGLALSGDGDRGRDRIMYGLWLAEAHLHNGDLEESCNEVAHVLPFVPDVGSARARELVQLTRDRLATHRDVPFVRDVLEQTDEALTA